MTKKASLQEKLAKATHHASGEVEYGLYIEHYTGVLYEFDGIPDETCEEDWRSTIYPHRSLERAMAGKASISGHMRFRNVHVVQRTVSPWEVKS